MLVLGLVGSWLVSNFLVPPHKIAIKATLVLSTPPRIITNKMSQKMIKLYHGVPLAKVVSKEFIDILDANGIEDLDTGGSYASSNRLPFTK